MTGESASEADVTLPTGFEDRVHDGQRYRFVRREPHLRLDGTPTTLMVFETECARCGEPFQTVWQSSSHSPNRRCARHRRPGSRVRR